MKKKPGDGTPGPKSNDIALPETQGSIPFILR